MILHLAESHVIETTKLKTIAQTTQMLAHDVRKPFSALKAILSRLDNIAQDPSVLERHRKEINRMMSQVEVMVNDIIDFSRETKFETKSHSILTVIHDAIWQTAQYFEGKSFDIQLAYDLKHHREVLINEEKMARVFANILTNGVEAITELGEHQHGLIQISTFEDCSSNMIITFENSGPPIAESHFAHLFNSTFSSGKTKGNGLGLASCKKIVEIHSGTIQAANLPEEQGVIFTITLPGAESIDRVDPSKLHANLIEALLIFDQNERTEVDTIIQQLRLSVQQGLSSFPIKILFLENESLYRASVKNIIDSHSSLKNIVTLYDANSVEEAIELIEKDSNILHAIVDIDLGTGLSGFDFLTQAKQISPQLDCMVHSNRYLKDDENKMRALGVSAIVPKPLNLYQLVSFLSNLDTKKEPLLPAISDQPHSLQPIVILLVDDQPLFLENTCFMVEEYFRINQKKVECVKATSYSEALSIIEDQVKNLDYVLSDLNIDFSQDGLMLANKVKTLNENNNREILFYIVTDSDVDGFNKIIRKDKVQEFFPQPLEMSSVHKIFNFPFKNIENTQYPQNYSNKNSVSTKMPFDVKKLSFLEIAKMCNPEVLRRIQSIVSHDLIGELTLVGWNIAQFSEKQDDFSQYKKEIPIRLAKITEQMNNFIDVLACSRLEKETHLAPINFDLSDCVNRLLQEFESNLNYSSFNVRILNKTKELLVCGDKTLTQKAVYKILLKVFQSYISSNRSGSIEFATSESPNQKELLLSYDFIYGDQNAEIMTSMFKNLPLLHEYFDLDYATSGYLMGIQDHQIKVSLDERNQKTTYHFVFSAYAFSY